MPKYVYFIPLHATLWLWHSDILLKIQIYYYMEERRPTWEIAWLYFSRLRFVCEEREIFLAPQSVSGWERERLTMSQADKKWLHSLSLAAVHCVHVHCTRRTPVHSHFPLNLFTGQGPGPVLCPALPGMTSHCNQGQTSLKYFLQSNPHKYLVHNQNLLLGWWMVLTC